MADMILVVDDDPGARELMSDVMQGEGYRTVEAADGREAQAVLEQQGEKIRAVILDWYMPKMSGIEFLRWMKARQAYENMPVVMETALDDPSRIKEGIDAGAFYYLTKPVQTKLLVSIVRAALSDRVYKETLLEQLAACQNPLSTLQEGTFRFKTLREAERLSVVLATSSPSPSRAMAISEILLNAVEHGNLGITYEEKTALLEAGTWQAEVERRLNLPENLNKTVTVNVERTPRRITVVVQDCGTGFDFEKFLHFDERRVFHTHGRGIALVGAAVTLQYLGNGNTARIIISEPQNDEAGR